MTKKLQNPFEIGELITVVNSTIDDVNEKQDTLIAGTNVTIENNVISAKGSIDNVDGVTAIVNEDDILQVTGMLEKNTGDAVFDWIGTREEYDSQNLANTHPDWICFITDDAQDTSNLLEQVNVVKNELTTKAVDNEVVHKTGNETISGDKVFTSIITATRFLGNNGSNENCDFKHQTHVGGWYLAGNKHTGEWQQIVTEIGKSLNTNGYFKYDNGMITQWGRSKFSSSQLTITFPMSFEGSNYSFIAIATDNRNGGYSYDAVNGVTSRTATSITIYAYYGNQNIDWIAIGY